MVVEGGGHRRISRGSWRARRGAAHGRQRHSQRFRAVLFSKLASAGIHGHSDCAGLEGNGPATRTPSALGAPGPDALRHQLGGGMRCSGRSPGSSIPVALLRPGDQGRSDPTDSDWPVTARIGSPRRLIVHRLQPVLRALVPVDPGKHVWGAGEPAIVRQVVGKIGKLD